jgi:4-amino-4-deoxy-L-arabinose transferase-like glycosyltransferase
MNDQLIEYAWLAFTPAVLLFVIGYRKASVVALLLAAFFVRILAISLDPYLHDWDERFHAVVAKNVMQFPFQPMLRLEAILPYKMEDWCCNYIWVHKQPLFLWQMALSMKIFGVNTFGLRLPDVLMGVLATYSSYRIAQIWTGKDAIALLSGILMGASFYQL